MSENEKKTTPGELISEEQLSAVSGGFPEGCSSNPYQSKECWFDPDGGPREDGRVRCLTHCKGLFVDNGYRNVSLGGPGANDGKWYICRCWGSDNCIDRWHKPCGHKNKW